MFSYVILCNGGLGFTYRESRFFKLANIPSGRNAIAFEDKVLKKAILIESNND